MERFPRAALSFIFILFFLLLPFPVDAQDEESEKESNETEEIPALIQEIDAKQYKASAVGLTDLQATVKSEQLQKQVPDLTIRLLWKAPNKKKVVIEGLPKKLERARETIAGQYEGLLNLLVGSSLEEEADGYTFEAKKLDDGGVRVTLAARDEANPTRRIQVWYDENYRPLRREVSFSESDTPSTFTYETKKVKDRYLVTSIKGKAATQLGPTDFEITYDYKEFDGVQIPTRLTEASQFGKNVTEFVDIKVNQGLSDDLFKKKNN